MQLDRYPYAECALAECPACGALFFHYVETGGHAPQERYRLVQPELIDLRSIRPTYDCLIEGDGLSYALHKTPELTYRLSTAVTVVPGLDVRHHLSADELATYLAGGIGALATRLEDMRVNYGAYEAVSWR